MGDLLDAGVELCADVVKVVEVVHILEAVGQLVVVSGPTEGGLVGILEAGIDVGAGSAPSSDLALGGRSPEVGRYGKVVAVGLGGPDQRGAASGWVCPGQ